LEIWWPISAYFCNHIISHKINHGKYFSSNIEKHFQSIPSTKDLSPAKHRPLKLLKLQTFDEQIFFIQKSRDGTLGAKLQLTVSSRRLRMIQLLEHQSVTCH